jgi:hypothetical protein
MIFTQERQSNTASNIKQTKSKSKQPEYIGTNTASNFNKKTTHKQKQMQKDDFFIFSQMDKKGLFGYENEKFQDEILKLKVDLNKKVKEISSLKAELTNVTNEDKKKLKLIEDILSVSGKSFEEIISILDGQSKLEKIELSANSIIRLREVYVINFLKNQVGQLKGLLVERDEEIQQYKNNIKVTKLSNLENEVKFLQGENEQLRSNYAKLNLELEIIDKNFKEQQYEHQCLYKKYLKKEREIEKSANLLVKMEEDNKILLNDKKKAEEHTNKYKLNMINMKADLKYKSDICSVSKLTDEDKVKYEKEGEALQKKIDDLKKENSKNKLEIK